MFPFLEKKTSADMLKLGSVGELTKVCVCGGPPISVEKEMATHASILAWKIPLTEEPGGLQSMGSQRVGHNLETKQRQHGYMTDFYAFILVSSTFMEITNHSQQ